MATLTTQNTWHGNPRGTVAYADTAYVNSVTSPYIHIPSGGSASTVPTYVSRQGPAPMVLTAAVPLLGAAALPYTSIALFNLVPLVPTGVWAKGTTLKIDVTNNSNPSTASDTVTVTIPRNVTQDGIAQMLVDLIGTKKANGDTGIIAKVTTPGLEATFGTIYLQHSGFTPANQFILTAITITAP